MKIAVTGSEGHLGNNICRKLLAKGDEVKGLVFDTRAKSLKDLDMEQLQGDIRDENARDRLIAGAEIVIHLAAIISTHGDPDGQLMDINVHGVKKVVDACLKHNVKRLLHMSSIHAHKQQPSDQPLNESREYVDHGAFAYDLSKARGEKEVLKGIEQGLDAVIFNPTGILGPLDFGPSRMGKRLWDAYHGKKIPNLVPGGFDWVDVRDVSDAVITSIDKGKKGEKYILSGHWCSMKEFALTIEAITKQNVLGRDVSIHLLKKIYPLIFWASKLFNKKPSYTNESLDTLLYGNRCICSDKAKQELGFKPRTLKETLEQSLEWFKANHKSPS